MYPMASAATENSKVMLFVQVLVCLISIVVHVLSAPITVTTETFNRCQKGDWKGFPVDCCMPAIVKTTGPVIDFYPRHGPFTSLRVRKALQCLTGEELKTYRQKLQKAYELMRALPDDDPRSLKMQNAIHCAYGTGSFLQDGSSNLTIDIHLNWYFLPYHRAYVYFHERILQKLLDDPEFTLHFWNFDNGVTVDPPSSTNDSLCDIDGCYKAGHFIPSLYSDKSAATFESNRSTRAFNASSPVDLTFDTLTYNPNSGPPVFQKRSLKRAVKVNAQIMRKSMLTDNTTRFMGHPYRVGDPRITSEMVGCGSLELIPHASVHIYVGGSMMIPQIAASDPLFFPFHANVERLWKVWHTLDENHMDPRDSDWLDTTFLLWDENAILRRIKVRDVLTTEQLGYTYQKVNDDSWISLRLHDSTQ